MLDIIIKNGDIIDGTGAESFRADVGIHDDKIAAVAQGLSEQARAAKTIDASGLIVSPGFIDLHTHSDLALLADPRYESKLRQGVTTDVLGLCGLGFAPASAPTIQTVQRYFASVLGELPPGKEWSSVAEFLSLFDDSVSLNVAYLIPHGTIRVEAKGFEGGAVSEGQLDRMKELVRQGMTDGAIGLSSGLTYFPACDANTHEIIELCKVVAEYGGIYATHMRNYGDDFRSALEEAAEIGEKARLPVHIAHFRLLGSTKGKADAILREVEEIRRRGVDLTIECYPYLLGCSILSSFIFPPSLYEGGAEAFIEKVQRPGVREALKAEAQKHDWAKIYIAGVGTAKGALLPENKRFEGMTAAAMAAEVGKDPFDACTDLLIEEKLDVMGIGIEVEEEDLRKTLAHPACTIGSDGILVGGRCHPRQYGAFARFLGEYVRTLSILSLEDAVSRITSRSAQRIGLRDRGLIKQGMVADVTIFDAERIGSDATYQQPAVYAKGVEHVIVNGKVVLENGEHTGSFPGRGLRLESEKVGKWESGKVGKWESGKVRR